MGYHHRPGTRCLFSRCKFLGVQIDEKLGWKEHIEYIRKKLSKSIGLLKKARQYFPKECLRSLYYTFIFPYLNYCIHVWGNTYVSYLDPIIKAHKRIIRIITHSNYIAHTAPLFRQLGILKLDKLYQLKLGIFMFKFKKRELPDIYLKMYTINSSIHDHETRQANNYHVPGFKLDVKKRAVSVQGALTWNGLPSTLKCSCSKICSCSENVFKFNMKNYLLSIT